MSYYRSLCCLLVALLVLRTEANPELIVPNVVIEAEQGGSVDLVWNYTFSPDLIFERWLKADTDEIVAIRSSGGEPKIFLDRAELISIASVRIRDLRKDDTGFYELHTIYADGQTDSRAVELIVSYGPYSMDIIVHPYPSYEGSDVNMTCIADSHPASNYTWIRENGDLPPDRMKFDHKTGMLSIKNATRNDADTYSCIAENGVGFPARDFMDLELRYSARSTSLQADPGWAWREGDVVTLRCTTDAFPPAIFTWSREDNGRIPARVEQNNMAGTLIFNGIQKEDVGTYICDAQNGIGRMDSAKFLIDQVLEALPDVTDSLGQHGNQGSEEKPASTTNGNQAGHTGGVSHVTSSVLLCLVAMLFSLGVCRL